MSVNYIREKYSFFGAVVAMQFDNENDRDGFNFFYSDYQCGNDCHPDLTIRFSSTDQAGVLRELLSNPALNFARYRQKGDRKFHLWRKRATIIPPFILPPLKGRFMLLHGAALVSACDGPVPSGMLIMAEHYQGKTSLTLSLIARAGFKYLTEDLIPFEVSTGLIYPMNKPGGVRYKTIDLVPGLRKRLAATKEKRKYVSLVTGDIYVGKLHNLYKGSHYRKPVSPKVVIFPSDKGEKHSRPNLRPITKYELFRRLTMHRFNAGLPVNDELRYCLSMAKECRGYVLEYSLQRHLGDAGKLVAGLMKTK
jgi:hypothetical protein